MQLFGLVNTMLAHDRTTAERDLSIARYAVIPLSPNSGARSVWHTWADLLPASCCMGTMGCTSELALLEQARGFCQRQQK